MTSRSRSPRRVSPPRADRPGLGSVNEPSGSLVQPGDDMPAGAVTMFPSVKLTPAEFAAAIAEQERALRDNRCTRRSARQRSDGRALTRACIEALRSTGKPLPRVPSMRVIRVWNPNGTPLPEDWSVLIEHDEALVDSAPLPAPFVGFVAVVARAADLPKPVVNAEAKRRPGGDIRSRVVPVGVAGPANDQRMDEHFSMLLFVDELAVLAADLWFGGKLEHLLMDEEPDHDCDE